MRRCGNLTADESAEASAHYDNAVTYNTAAVASVGVAARRP